MSSLKKKLMIRVITKRMAAGETFEEVIADYPKLTEAEIEELKAVIE
ncbi:MAG: DUF433 domain-containing protein [Lachnospiraceae bacterium]|nr:DUF433 domain-containing protein [Lachnospiraceae bacterium]